MFYSCTYRIIILHIHFCGSFITWILYSNLLFNVEFITKEATLYHILCSYVTFLFLIETFKKFPLLLFGRMASILFLSISTSKLKNKPQLQIGQILCTRIHPNKQHQIYRRGTFCTHSIQIATKKGCTECAQNVPLSILRVCD